MKLVKTLAGDFDALAESSPGTNNQRKTRRKILESRAIYQASCPCIGKVVFGSQSDSVTQECLCRCL